MERPTSSRSSHKTASTRTPPPVPKRAATDSGRVRRSISHNPSPDKAGLYPTWDNDAGPPQQHSQGLAFKANCSNPDVSTGSAPGIPARPKRPTQQSPLLRMALQPTSEGDGEDTDTPVTTSVTRAHTFQDVSRGIENLAKPTQFLEEKVIGSSNASLKQLSAADTTHVEPVSDLRMLLGKGNMPSLQDALAIVTSGTGIEMKVLQDKQNSVKSLLLKIDRQLHVLMVYKRGSDKIKYITLESVHEIRIARFGRFWRKLKDNANPELGFLVIFGEKYEELGVLTKSVAERNEWICALHALTEDRRGCREGDTIVNSYHLWVRREWRQRSRVDKSTKCRSMDVTDLSSLCSALNVKVSTAECVQLIYQATDGGNKVTSVESFQRFMDTVHLRSGEAQVFVDRSLRRQTHNGPGVYWTIDQVTRFITTDQMDQETNGARIQAIYDQYKDADGMWTIGGFVRYLHSAHNDIHCATDCEPSQDMERPLCEYFINSSHNTYLLGDQLRSTSSVEAYIRVLLSGCRCVELDVWDGADGLPVIYHGHTLTSKMSFEEAVRVIRNYAFEASSYPLILSIENHCSVVQQGYMANHLKTHLGDMLCVPRMSDRHTDTLPSPRELMHKILIKNKKNQSHPSNESSDNVSGSITSALDEEIDQKDYDQQLIRHLQNVEGISQLNMKDYESEETAQTADQITVAVELSQMVTYCQPTDMRAIKHAIHQFKYYEMTSLSEGRMQRFAKKETVDLVRYNVTRLSRIYPAGFRVDSSNYNPMTAWNCGCQLVALNFQTPDKAMHLNKAVFKANSGCGYILKPAYLRDVQRQFNPNVSDVLAASDEYPELTAMMLTVTVHSAQFLPKMTALDGMLNSLTKPLRSKDKADAKPYFKIVVVGTPCDSREYKSEPRESFVAPEWNHSEEFAISAKMLCFVCFEMHYTGVGLIGSYTINLDTMKQGYRYVYLEDNEGTALSPVALFVHLRLETKPAYDYRKNDEARQKVAARAAGTQAPPNALASKTSAPLHHSNSVPAQHYSPTNGHVNGNTSAHRQQSYNAPGFMMPPPAFQCSPQPPQPPHAQQQHQPPPLPYAQPQPSPQAPSHTHAQNTQQPQQANQYPPQPHYAPALPPRPSPRAQQPIQPQYQYAPPTAYSYGGPPPHPNAPMPRGYQPNEASPSPVHQTLPHPSTPHPHPQSQSYQQQRPPSYGLGPESRLTHNPRPPQHHSPTTTVACPYCTVQFEGVAGTTMTCHVCLGVFTG